MARFIKRRRYPPFKIGSVGEANERWALRRSRSRTTLDEKGRSLAVSDDAVNTFEEWGRTPDEVEQNFREMWYSDKPEELQQRIRETKPPIKSETIVENFMIPDKTKPKKGRGGLIDFFKAKKKLKKKKSGAELTAELLGKRQQLNRQVERLFKHRKTPRLNPNKLEEIIIEPKPDPITGRIGEDVSMSRFQVEVVTPGERYKVYDIWDSTTNTFRKKPKFVHMRDSKGNILLKEKKNMGGLLSLYE